jgi:hypothetical protein
MYLELYLLFISEQLGSQLILRIACGTKRRNFKNKGDDLDRWGPLLGKRTMAEFPSLVEATSLLSKKGVKHRHPVSIYL